MVDWAKITADLEYALTLDAEAAAEFLNASVADTESRDLTRGLLARARPTRVFMQTSSVEQTPPSQAVSLQSETRIDHWEIEDLIGKGGMGEVYKARRADGLYEQTIALKLIHNTGVLRTKQFKQERQRLARLEHPNIARIVDGGTAPDGRAYLAMEYVRGETIQEYVNANNLGVKEILDLFRSLCGAVSYAHSQLVLHRDIKTENVLVDARGHVRLIDFGIATGLDDDEAQILAFTIHSAAPEQLEGRPESVQTDVFALGVLLHRLVTQRFPERRNDGGMWPRADLVQNKDLLAILKKCLSASAEDRFTSVNALVSDVSAFLETRAVKARNGGWVYRLKKDVSRNPLSASLSAVTALALSAGLIVSLNFASIAGDEAERAQIELQRAEWALAEAELNADVAQAYSDSMQKLFGNDADVARMGNVLEQHWAEAWTDPNLTEQEKAVISFAVGEHFSSRGDHTKAIKVLEPWIQSGGGEPRLLSAGKNLIALPYLVNGETQKATQQVTEAAAMFEGTFLENSPEHVTAAVRAAFFNHKPEEFDKAKRLARGAIETTASDVQKVRLWNQLMRLNLRTRDWPEALAASRNAAALVEGSINYPIVNEYRHRLNALEMEFYIGKQREGMTQKVSNLVDEMEANTGDSFDLGLAYLIKAVSERDEHNLDAAKTSIVRALELAETYSEEGRHIDLKFTAMNVLILADLGDIAGAQKEIEFAAEITQGRPDRWRDIMTSYLILKNEGKIEAATFLRAAKTDLHRARAYVGLNYILDEMTKAGMDWSGLEPEAP